MNDPTDTSQWQRLGALFDQAIEMESAQQAELVRMIEREDAALAHTLASLLAADARHQAATAEHHGRVLQGSLEVIEGPGVAVGDRVGPYVLREILGRGGMGVVFRAERVEGAIREEVALKIIRRALLDDCGRERFQREREIVAAFHHPYIARMLDVGQTADGSPYLAMELVHGLPITDYCDARKLDTRRRIEVFVRVCEAVQHAHANKVLHRDLKPGNVLIEDGGNPKLIDFGIAKALTFIGASEQQQTTTTHRFFSPSNAAPEQLGGERIGVTCDIYQLGTLLHELLCGAAVFDAKGLTPGQLEERILQAAPEAPSARAARASVATAHAHAAATPAALARALRGDLDAIVALALRKLPQERYASAEHLADDLRCHLARRPVEAQRGQRWYRTRRFLRRNALAIGASTALAVLVGGLVTAIWDQATQIANERDPEMPYYGDKGLYYAVDKGLIRRATANDLRAWDDAQARMPRAGSSLAPTAHTSSLLRSFVVLKPLRLPAGLYGTHTASFYVPRGVPMPTGNRGQSLIHDFNTMECVGLGCN